jgi:hypothetical protein
MDRPLNARVLAKQLLEQQTRRVTMPLSECLAIVGTAKGCGQLRETLAKQPFPHYEPAPVSRRRLIRIDEDGTRTIGRFVNRSFVSDSGETI